MNAFTPQDITRLESYMRDLFQNKSISVRVREKAKESAEVLINGEFVGIVYKDTDEGETSFDFNMAMLEADLPEAA